MQNYSMSIQLKNINCFYGQHQALFDINLECGAGETMVLLGPSGAGKSSLLRALNLLEMPRSGELTIADHHFNFATTPSAGEIRALRQNVGMVFQQYNLWPHLTVMDNLTEAPVRVLDLTREAAQAKAEKLLARLRLTDFANRFPLHLSGGQQQRVAIARALMQQAKVILADEPIASLDPESARIVMDTLRDINQNDGITVVVTLHQVDYALRYCERIVALRQGHVFYDGSSQQFDNERFDHLYRSINRVEENAKAA